MLYLLDTNHFRELAWRPETASGERLRQRMGQSGGDFATTIITADETLRGWLAKVASAKTAGQQIWAYDQLGAAVLCLADYSMLPWDAEAVARFEAFQVLKLRAGTMDLRIACIALEYDATILTRNTADFAKIPGVRFENWLD